MSEPEPEPDEHDIEPLRPEQRKLLGAAVADDGNCVVVASTGFGKTRVAFAVVAAALQRHPDRAVVFLCPTVPLANQQRDYWDRTSPAGGGADSAVVAGSGSGSFFGRAKVTFGTPAKFLASVKRLKTRGARWGSALSLLVLDECHHAHRLSASSATGESRHPYTEVATIYLACLPSTRPKLIGLTASPGVDEDDILGLAKVLQARFLCAEGPELAPNCKTTVVVAEDGEELAEQLLTLERRCIDAQRERDFDTVAGLVGLAALWRAVGQGSTLRACRELEESGEECLVLGEELYPGASGASPVFNAVFSALVDECDASGDDFRAVVFVETQMAACATVDTIKRRCKHDTKVSLRPGLLVGQSGPEGMTMAGQRAALDRFRRGEVNVLLATSIAEEGLDIQKCGLVIRTEPPHNIIQNIQGRGRARRLDATYNIVILDGKRVQRYKKGKVVSSVDEQQYVDELLETEESAKAALKRCIAHEALACAATSWSQFEEVESLAKKISKLRIGGDGGGGGDSGDEDTSSDDDAAEFDPSTDWKSKLNLWLQQTQRPDQHVRVATYSFTRSGPAHAPAFVSTVTVHDDDFDGDLQSTKKESEQTAAFTALRCLKDDY